MALSGLALQALGGLLNMGIQLGGQYLSNKMNQSMQGGSLSGSTGSTSSASGQTGMTSQSMGQSMASQTGTVQQGSVGGLAGLLQTALGTATGNNAGQAFQASQGSATTANNLMSQQWNNANLLNFFSSAAANIGNAISQTSAKRYNTKEAEAARAWQQMMRGTAYQDTVKDLKAAGLNPILAAYNGATATPSSGGASIGSANYSHTQAAAIPSAKTATMQAMYDYGNNTAQIVQNYAQAIMSAKQIGMSQTAQTLSQSMSQIVNTSAKQVSQTSQTAGSIYGSQSESHGSQWGVSGEAELGTQAGDKRRY